MMSFSGHEPVRSRCGWDRTRRALLALSPILLIILIAGAVRAEEPKSLFNGKNLDGWKIHGTEKWYAEDGLLICESGPDEEYARPRTSSGTATSSWAGVCPSTPTAASWARPTSTA